MDIKQIHTEEDFIQIEELHRRDVEASQTGDFQTLRSLLTDDAVMMPPNENWIRGAEELKEDYQHMEEAMDEVEILDYQLEFEEVKILGDYAFEWGTIHGATRIKDEGIERASYKVMRILRKDERGIWKVHRAIWNNNPVE